MIVRNSALCLVCRDHIESVSQHDFVSCNCDNIFVDGGHTYLRHGAADWDTYEDTSIVTNELEVA